MELTQSDVEAIAKARVSRVEARKTNQYTIGAIVLMIVGILVAYKVMIGVGYGLVIVGALALLYYMNVLSKKQNTYKDKLVNEWKKEQGAK